MRPTATPTTRLLWSRSIGSASRAAARAAAAAITPTATIAGPDGEGITVVGTPGPDIIVGTNCDDLLRGRGGDDGISGRGGDDNIGGGRGKDQLVGGSGDDTFVFGRATGRDVIRDFGNGDDLIDVSRLNIDFDDVKQRTNAAGDTVIKFEGFTGPDAPKIVLDGVGFLEASDFIF
jgi:Ca2+-binding RTX toxin-like protein